MYQSRIPVVIFSYQIPFLIVQILYRLKEDHKNVEVTVKNKLTGVPVFSTGVQYSVLTNFKNTVTMKAEADRETSCRFIPQDLLLSMLYPLSDHILSTHSQEGHVSVRAHYRVGNKFFFIIARNPESLMLSTKKT